ncbi:MAG TPA: tryptophan--tRNA ligase, partial [Candidatus Gracilibacteria bacterium]
NTIEIFCEEVALKKKVMSIQTDSIEMGDPIPLDCTPMLLHRLFENPHLADLEAKCRKGSVGFGDVKKELFGLIWDYFAPARARREKLLSDPAEVERILKIGAEKANAKAEETLQKVRNKMGMGPHLV